MPAPEPQSAARAARHPLVERILAASAPEAIRLTAARGALPLPLQDLIYAQIRLLDDALPAVVQAATGSLADLADDALLPIVGDPACDPIVLDYFVRAGRLRGDALEAAIAHPAVLDDTLAALAASAPTETLNLIVTNEVRLIRNPHLLEVLRGNPQLSGDNRRRLAELERDFIGKEQLKVRDSATHFAQGGIAAALSDEDEVSLHLQDTLAAGDGEPGPGGTTPRRRGQTRPTGREAYGPASVTNSSVGNV